MKKVRNSDPLGTGSARCQSCGKLFDANRVQFEHIKPIIEGGTDDPSNLLVLCPRCATLRLAARMSTLASAGQVFGRWWAEKLTERPKPTALLTLSGAATLLVIVLFGDGPTSERQQPPTFAEQIRALDDTQRSLDRLSQFVSNQREQMAADQSALSRLQKERKSIEPLLLADQRTIQALLRVQEERAEASLWRAQVLSFIFGFLASLLASAVFAAIAYFVRRRAGRPPEASE